MKSPRIWFLLGAAILLGVWYVASFTEWLRPEPIEIIAQFRPLPKDMLARRGRARVAEDSGGARPGRVAGSPTEAKAVTPWKPAGDPRVGPRGGPGLGRGGGRDLRDVQPFVFSLDGRYRLTALKVVETSSTNATPPIAWWVRSKSGSPPTDNILYGRAPDSLAPIVAGTRPAKLLPGRTYTLFVEAGRRRGQKSFTVPPAAEPVPPDDGDYHPEKDPR